uniref:Keratin 98 n=1 Tax=Gadus morhua TaxID=8049 RepID=A0A8C4ZG75_GADMO
MSFTSRSYSSQRPTTSYSKGSFNLADGLDLTWGPTRRPPCRTSTTACSTYLDQVRTLEKENGRLEQQIREWTLSRTVVTHDHSGSLATIRFAYRVNAKIILDIDNAKLAADDFKMKFEGEQAMRLVVEADTMGLKRVLDEMNMNRMDLESMYESLKEELIMLKRKPPGVGGQVDVEVDTPPATDLNQAMTEVREHYETMITKNRKELESWYQSKQESELLLKARMELKELKTTCQRLQIDLQSHLSMVGLARSTLYGLQCTVTSLEEQLSQLHANIAHHKQEYDMLLDLKTRLEYGDRRVPPAA